MIRNLFEQKKEPLLNLYFTAGFPALESMPEILTGMQEGGTDMVEIGISYSDPISDGPTIQNSNSIAIKNGITTDLIFQQLSTCTSTIPKIIIFYFFLLFLYGIYYFFIKCL